MSKINLYKGSLTAIVLSILAEKGKMYGCKLTREVENFTHGELIINEGALYPILHKLEANELISAEVNFLPG